MKTIPKDVAISALEPVRKVAEGQGVKAMMAIRLSDITGQTFTRQMVDRWLKPVDPVEPRLGVAILLYQIGNEIDPIQCPPTIFAPGAKQPPAKKQKPKNKPKK